MADSPKHIWMNGNLKPWSEGTVHVSTLGWSTIAGVFEGIKAYWNQAEGELYGLHFQEHYQRLHQSMKLQRMKPQWSVEELVQASVELLRANETRDDTYVRPLAYFGETTAFGTQIERPTHLVIWTYSFKTALGTEKTIKACVSSWTRVGDNQLSPRVKCFSNYQNSRLALIEAQMNGYDVPIMLNAVGKVTEGPAACLFIVRDGLVITPGVSSGLLESITRASVLRLCRGPLEIPTFERDVERTELYVADEAFFCGTNAEVTPIATIDGIAIGDGKVGSLTRRIRDAYTDVVRGRDQRFRDWLVPVYRGATKPALQTSERA